jgi:hypothetical protein
MQITHSFLASKPLVYWPAHYLSSIHTWRTASRLQPSAVQFPLSAFLFPPFASRFPLPAFRFSLSTFLFSLFSFLFSLFSFRLSPFAFRLSLFDFDLGFDLKEASLPPRQKRFPGRAAGMRREGALSWERIAPGPSGKGIC